MPTTTCDLCGGTVAAGSLTFLSVDDEGEIATLNLRLCGRCGTRLEKHLKRAIPRRFIRYYRGATRTE